MSTEAINARLDELAKLEPGWLDGQGESIDPYRLRRGKWVAIPLKWLCHVTSSNTINRRQSKQVRRNRQKPTTRMKVTCEEDQDKHLRRTSKRRERIR